jgi:hypothetical protein
MSNSEPSAIVLHGILCVCGLYKFRFEWKKTTRGGVKVNRFIQIAAARKLQGRNLARGLLATEPSHER